MNIEEAKRFLREVRDFRIEDLEDVKYRIYDEDYSFYVYSDEELIEYALEQKQDEDVFNTITKKEQRIIKEIMRRNNLNIVYYDDLEG